jgi:hypothetical protein
VDIFFLKNVFCFVFGEVGFKLPIFLPQPPSAGIQACATCFWQSVRFSPSCEDLRNWFQPFFSNQSEEPTCLVPHSRSGFWFGVQAVHRPGNQFSACVTDVEGKGEETE